MRRRCASIEEMASNVRCARRLRPLWRWASSSSTAAARPKFYKEKPKYYKEVAQTYAKFRREVSGLRKEFRRQWTEQQRMTQTQFSAKAAEEARQKEMEETRAFEAAARELERMARERYADSNCSAPRGGRGCFAYPSESAMQREEERVKEKREKGAIARQQWEEQLLESVARKNEAAEVSVIAPPG